MGGVISIERLHSDGVFRMEALKALDFESSRSPRGVSAPTDSELPRRRPARMEASEWRDVILALFRTFRAVNLTPWPIVPAHSTGDVATDDALWAEALAASLAAEFPGEEFLPEAGVRIQADLGMNCQPVSVGFGDPSYAHDKSAAMHGWAHQVVADARRLGCGFFRRFSEPDLHWRGLFPGASGDAGELIPPPAEIPAKIAADDYSACADFTLLLIFCALAGVRLLPTLFDYGGGSRSADRPEALDLDEEEIASLIPAHLEGARLLYPSKEGWDEFYYRNSERSCDMVRKLQQYALFLVVPDGSPWAAYQQECARRKSLALLAYAEGIANYFTVLRRAFIHCRVALDTLGYEINLPKLEEVIPYLTAGNEMDFFWCIGDGRDSDAALEMARFHTLVTAPLATRFRRWSVSTGFGLAELSSGKEGGVLEWTPQRLWLRRVLSRSLPQALFELQWLDKGSRSFAVLIASWRSLPSDTRSALFPFGASHEDLIAFQNDLEAMEATSVAAGYRWPAAGVPEEAELLAMEPRDLVELVGLHWYHACWVRPTVDRVDGSLLPGPGTVESDLWLDESELAERIEEFLDVVKPYTQNWWISEIGFPAETPQDDQLDSDSRWNPVTSPSFQAAVVARRLLFLKALPNPPLMIGWWTTASKVAGIDEGLLKAPPWTQFSAMGLRNDLTVQTAGEPFGQIVDFEYGRNAWPRPAWYAFRRAAWLLSHATALEIAHHDRERGFVVLHLTGHFRDPDRLSSERYDNAIVAWAEHGCEASRLLIPFTDCSGRGFTRISLVPEVEPTFVLESDISAPDANGYANGNRPVWRWRGWDPGTILRVGAGWMWTWHSELWNTDPPLCVLFDGEVGFDAGSPEPGLDLSEDLLHKPGNLKFPNIIGFVAPFNR